jgi:adenine-specific DNA-methyltransferase
MVAFDDAHSRVKALCDHFDARHGEVISPDYREAVARAEFITPFFEALGWDVNNAAHRTIYEKDCVLEKAEAHGGTQRSADYAFRRPGTHLTAFFVEAKKPSIEITHHDECYQAVLYGWNASTPLVALTNFKQFLILDARSRPDKHNAASHILRENGRYTYRDYRDAEKFTEIWGLFSRQAAADGSIDKASAALPRLSGRIRKDELFARGIRAVDDDFLAQMERWRETLAKSLKRTNQSLDGEALTSITQRVLDRLIFLRFLEDRLIERDVTFDQIGRSGSAWRDFERVSDRLDARYNGIIYKHDRDGADNPGLYVDDTAFASVVENLEPRNSDYKFATIPLTILGSIYERFLGKVIVAKPKTAEVVWKPENLKQHGVYYTPDYIVRYIVDQTVGHCIETKLPKQIDAANRTKFNRRRRLVPRQSRSARLQDRRIWQKQIQERTPNQTRQRRTSLSLANETELDLSAGDQRKGFGAVSIQVDRHFHFVRRLVSRTANSGVFSAAEACHSQDRCSETNLYLYRRAARIGSVNLCCDP